MVEIMVVVFKGFPARVSEIGDPPKTYSSIPGVFSHLTTLPNRC